MDIPLLQDLLDQYEQKTLDMSEMARKCYLTELDKHFNRVTWIHNDALEGHLLLRKMGSNFSRDLLRNSTR